MIVRPSIFVMAIALLPVSAAGHGAVAQDVTARSALVTVTASAETVSVGQPFFVRIRVRAPKVATIRFPALPDSGDAVEPIDPRIVEQADDAAAVDRTAVYRVAAWDIGTRTVRFASVGVSVGGVEQLFSLRVPPVVVRSVLPSDTASRKPKGARAPLPVPSGLWRFWLLLGVLLTGIAWYFWRRPKSVPRPIPPPDAYSAAQAALGSLDEMALHECGEPARHVIAHVDVMRAYVARRFPAAPESCTATEFVAAVAPLNLPVTSERLRALLQLDESLRFAGAAVTPDDAAFFAREARTVVQGIQAEHEARLRAEDRGPQRPKRR